MFKHFHKLKTKHQILLSILIAFAVVTFWRGAWGLIDMYWLPTFPELSYWTSLFIGLGILLYTGYATTELM